MLGRLLPFSSTAHAAEAKRPLTAQYFKKPRRSILEEAFSDKLNFIVHSLKPQYELQPGHQSCKSLSLLLTDISHLHG
jgi:hypothetical protein